MNNLGGSIVPLSGDNLIDAMTNGYKWDLSKTRTINWSISKGWDGQYWLDPSYAITELRKIFYTFSYYANINFQYIGYASSPLTAYNAGSDINITFATFESNVWAFGFPPSPDDANKGDIYINANSFLNYAPSYAPGSVAFTVGIHEVGHTLGLKHPHDDGGTGRPKFQNLQLNDFDIDYMTVMSYNESNPLNYISWHPATPMVLDVLALQYLYGKNYNVETGNSIYILKRANLFYTEWDPSGNDTVDQSTSSEGWLISLPDIYLSNLVDTKTGFGMPLSDYNKNIYNPTKYPPTSLTWLLGDLENVSGSLFDDAIIGNRLDNVLKGNSGNDIIKGLAGNDLIVGGQGDDQIDGGDGFDTSIYNTNSKNFLIFFKNTIIYVKDKINSDGTDSIKNIEFINFSDGTLDASSVTKMSALSAEKISSLVQLYIASFNRAPDSVGLNYWGGRLSDGMSLQDIAKSFFVQKETIAAYPSTMPLTEFVNTVYKNVLNRAADANGSNYWVGELNNGHVSKDSFLLAIINGAQAPTGGAEDRLTLANKQKVGAYYALEQGLNNSTNWAKDVMSGVNANASSVTDANTKTDYYATLAANPATSDLVVKLVGIYQSLT